VRALAMNFAKKHAWWWTKCNVTFLYYSYNSHWHWHCTVWYGMAQREPCVLHYAVYKLAWHLASRAWSR